MRRFWAMVAHYHGNHWNGAEIGRALGVSGPTTGAYLDALVDALVVRRLAPWYESLKKRQVKAPRVYIADTGLLHALLALDSAAALLGHPKAGASWEGFAMQEAVRILGVDWDRCYYWATHQGAELDLLAFRDGPSGRVRIQANERTTAHAIDANGNGRSRPGPSLRGVPGRFQIPHGRKSGGGRAGVRVRRGAVTWGAHGRAGRLELDTAIAARTAARRFGEPSR